MSTADAPPPANLDWSHARPGGAIFRTHTLRHVGPTRIEFHPSLAARVVLGVIAVLSIVFPAVGAWFYVTRGDVAALLVSSTVAVFMIATAILVGRMQWNYRVFDGTRGRYWNTRDSGSLREPGERSLALTQIIGLQLVQETVRTSDGEFHPKELNLVLADGKRECVVDYDNGERLREDARALAHWLEVPLWDHQPEPLSEP